MKASDYLSYGGGLSGALSIFREVLQLSQLPQGELHQDLNAYCERLSLL